MTFKRLLSILTCVAFLGFTPAQAETPPQYVQITLTPAVSAAAPGEPFDLVIEQNIADGWHTYWINPGDSGVPLTASWTFPNGGTAGDLRFPTPSRIPFGPLTNFGYNARALHTATLTPPATAKSGDVFTANVQLDWLVCHDICLPEGGAYTVSVPIQEKMEPNTGAAPLLADVLKTHPIFVEWDATFSENNGEFTFFSTSDHPDLIYTSGKNLNLDQAFLFPVEWGLIDNTTAQTPQYDGSEDLIHLPLGIVGKRGDRPLTDIQEFQAVLSIPDQSGQPHGYQMTVRRESIAPLSTHTTAPQSPDIAQSPASSDSLFVVLGFALLGGLILNLMPCVFPVLFIKILAIAKLSGAERAHATHHGLMYALGVVITFVGLALIFVTLQSAGTQIGWGFQLQSPIVVGLLMALFIGITLNLAGVFEIDFTRFIPSRLQSIDDRSHVGSFLTGILAVAVATPCTVPFMGAAVAYGLTNGPVMMILVFTALGLGLALPFVILTSVPALMRLLPRPGTWMLTFRRICAVPMAVTAIWLGSVLLVQTNLWPVAETSSNETVLPYTPVSLDQALATDRPVFVNMTAAWCITCKYNEQVAIATESTQDLFKRLDVTYIKGDWTTQDPDITTYLNQFGHKGVPLYVFYPAPNAQGTRPTPVVLPQLLTNSIIHDALTQKEPIQ
jgi:DsbC/DsbD-like thiol-disulfide interchange protein/cytochrome c biogenesis protein CcdA